jgi:hypothetical protein
MRARWISLPGFLLMVPAGIAIFAAAPGRVAQMVQLLFMK